MEHGDHIGVARRHPGMEEGVPMDGILLAQAPVQRVGVGQHGRIEETIKAQARVVSENGGHGPSSITL